VDASQLLRAAARAVPLHERGTARCTAGDRLAKAERTLQRWRAQRPFGQDGWFERRLAADGLDPDGLRALLAEDEDALARRLAGAAGSWAGHLADCFARQRDGAAAPHIPDAHAFARVVTPLLTDARDRLYERIAALGPTPLGGPGALTDLFVPALTARLHALAARTLILELHVARLSGALGDDTESTPEQRFQRFLRRAARPAAALALLAEYPVLARRLTVAARRWTDAYGTLVEQLAADLPLLGAEFGGGAPLGPLLAVDTGLGDPHRGGRSVTGLRFAHARFLHKPRPLDVDLHYQLFLRRLNRHLELPLAEVTCLPRDGYGWMAHVSPRPCRDRDELRRFYRRAGSLAAVLYLLQAVDCHAQNLVAAGEDPVLVDLETLFQPQLREPAKTLSGAERLARHDTAHSVLRSGLLPQRMWVEDGHDGADLSALGWDPGRLPPRPVPDVADAGTDRMRIVYRRLGVEAAASRPVPPGRPLRLADHAADLDAGFTQAYEALARDKRTTRTLLESFAGDETRLLRRDTYEYRSLLSAACHPDLLRDALDQDRHLDRLWALAAWEEGVEPFVPHERADLWDNDIPVFTVRPGSTDARASSGAVVPDVTDRPALTAALDRLDLLGPRDLERQRNLLRLSVTATPEAPADGPVAGATGAASGGPVTGPGPVPSGGPVTDVAAAASGGPGRQAVAPRGAPDREAVARRALGRAADAAEWLLAAAYRTPEDLAWSGPDRRGPGVWTPAVLGPDLYSGTAGIALFLHQLADVTGDRGHRAAARAAARTLRLQTLRLAGRLGGGLCGTGGVLYALAHLAAGDEPEDWDGPAAALLRRAAATAAEDTAYDIVGGGAGTLAGLAAWRAVRPGAGVDDAIRACADRLVTGALPQPTGAGWVPAALAHRVAGPLAGFAHGSSGIAWALGGAAALLGEARWAEAAHAALAHERTLFDAAAANWRDVRADGTPEGPSYPALWCHGAGGVGIARLGLVEAGVLSRREAAGDLAAAVGTVLRSGFGRDFSLCHGDFGNLDLLLHAAPGEAWRRAPALLDDLDRRGWVCGLPAGLTSPSLLVGVAGIGHGLLRLAAPDRVRSVAALRPPAV
jgi:type 2 lantibiotic biosynthesis protein LanM